MSSTSSYPHNRYYDILIIIGLYTIIPFFVLCIFNQPSVDDFEYAVRDNRNSFVATQIETYYNWSGRYFSTAISRINPIRVGSWIGYKISSFLFLCAFILTLHVFVSSLFYKLASRQKLTLTLFITALYFSQMPDVSRGLYYMTAYLVYQLPNILTLVLLVLLTMLFSLRGKTAKFLCKIGILVACLSIIGTNELSLIYLLTTLSLLLLQLWRIQHQAFNFILVVFICSLVASLGVVLAPGNYVRMETTISGAGNIMWSSMTAAILILKYFYKWGALLTVASILYMLLWQRGISFSNRFNNAFDIPLPVSVAVFITTLFLMSFAYSWSTGGETKGSVGNVIYFYFIMGWFYNLHVVINRFPTHFQQIGFPSVLAIPVMLLFARLIFNIDNNVSTAYLDLLSGKATRHDKELNKRYTFLRTSDCKVCAVEPLSGMPKTLYIYDLTHKLEDRGLLKNSAIRKYWGKEEIYLSEPSLINETSNSEVLHQLGAELRANLGEKMGSFFM
ncbi:DUF6056 family protein [Pontibacter locisalis]|uniref:DUF6056 family protein n=1 Tax=Pontibacter locisalis TaxID=1719035 RepID=A0ABW5IJA9_9BACT